MGTDQRKRLGTHGELGYNLPLSVPIRLAYRVAFYEPWLDVQGGVAGLDDRDVHYHTFGVRVDYPDDTVGLSGFVDYTVTIEQGTRSLDNSRLQFLVQLVF